MSSGYLPGTAPSFAVSLRNVFKNYGDVIAVTDLSLDVQDGEFFALLGPSGCGKTTTLKMVGGFEPPSSGEVLIHGRSVRGVPSFRRNVNTVFQDYALFPHLNVRDNVAFGLRMKGVGRRARQRAAHEALESVHLIGLGRRRVHELSGGQQQRVALARALINRPTVLLLDEPLGALDFKLRKAMQLELKRIQRDVGISFVYVTHDQEEALTMADRIAVMHEGRALQIAGPKVIYERPTSRFVAAFIGASSFLSGRIQQGDGRTEAELILETGEVLRAPPLEHGNTAATATAMVRPERIRLIPFDEKPSTGLNAVRGFIDWLEYAGSDTNYYVVTRSGNRMIARRSSSENGAELARGTEVWAVFEIVDTVLLPDETDSIGKDTFEGGAADIVVRK